MHLEEKDGGYHIVDMGPLSIRDAAMWRELLTNDADYWKDKPIKTVLWDVASWSHQAGYAVDEEALCNHADFKSLICQLKFNNGDRSYAGAEAEMEQWLKTNSPIDLRNAYMSINKNRNVTKGTIHGENIDHLLMRAMGVRPEDYF